jgi:hypothetical protein
LHDAVKGLKEVYTKANKPKVDFDLTNPELQGLAGSNTVSLNKAHIETNYRYAAILFHEYRHVIQYIVPYKNGRTMFGHWVKVYGWGQGGKGGVWDRAET